MQQKKVTLQDIADHAEVSISTVSRVLTGSATVKSSKRQTVLSSALALGYHKSHLPAELWEEQPVVGIVTQHISNPYYGNIMYGVFDGLRPSQCAYVVTDGGWNIKEEQRVINTLRGRQVSGLIILGGTQSPEVYEALAQETPLILVGQVIDSIAMQCLVSNNEQGGYQVTRHLCEMGHRQIAHIAGPTSQPDGQARQQGYERALREFGLAVDPDLIVNGAFSEQSGVLAVEMLLTRKTSFSAIFAANDLMANGARLAMHRRGIRVPQDVSLVGYDNQPGSAYMLPPLTTVKQPDYELGKVAAQRLLNLLNQEPIEAATFEPELILRESVARVF